MPRTPATLFHQFEWPARACATVTGSTGKNAGMHDSEPMAFLCQSMSPLRQRHCVAFSLGGWMRDRLDLRSAEYAPSTVSQSENGAGYRTLSYDESCVERRAACITRTGERQLKRWVAERRSHRDVTATMSLRPLRSE